MIDFACKRFQLREVVRCGLELSKADFSIFQFLLTHSREEFSSIQLEKNLSFDLSTLQRSLKKLHEKEVLIRQQRNIPNGGYTYVYRCKSRKDIKQIVLSIVQNWTKRVETELGEW